MSENFVLPGQYTIRDVYIKPMSGPAASIKSAVINFVMTESIDGGYITGSLRIAETADVIGSFPILGDETVIVVLEAGSYVGDSDDAEQRVEYFRVETIDNVGISEEKDGLSYTLSLISEWYYHQSGISCTTAYEDTISNIVNSVYKKSIGDVNGGSLTVQPSIEIDETDLVVQTIMPSETPFFCMNMLTRYAYSEKHKTNCYFFFQNKNGFNFRNIESIYNEWNSKSNDDDEVLMRKLIYPQAPIERQDPAISRIITAITQNFRSTPLALYKKGALSHTVKEIDYVLKRVQKSDYLVTNTIGEYKLPTTMLNLSETFLSSYGSSKDEDLWILKDGSKKDMKYREVVNHMYTVYQILFSNIITVRIPGNPQITCGDVVDLLIPRQIRRSSGARDLDQFMSGKYFVKDAIHMFDTASNRYEMQLNLFRAGTQALTNEIE